MGQCQSSRHQVAHSSSHGYDSSSCSSVSERKKKQGVGDDDDWNEGGTASTGSSVDDFFSIRFLRSELKTIAEGVNEDDSVCGEDPSFGCLATSFGCLATTTTPTSANKQDQEQKQKEKKDSHRTTNSSSRTNQVINCKDNKNAFWQNSKKWLRNDSREFDDMLERYFELRNRQQ